MEEIDAEKVRAKASDLLSSGEVLEALSMYHILCEHNPKDSKSWYKLGMAYMSLDKPKAKELACKCLKKACHLAPDQLLFRSHYANVLVMSERMSEAVKEARTLVSMNQHSADAHTFLGNLLASQQQIEEALTHLEKAIEIDQTCALAYAIQAQIYASLRRFDEAGKSVTAALKYDPENAIARQLMLSLRQTPDSGIQQH